MKKVFRKLATVLLIFAVFVSCNTGLGELVDIEAPEVKVSRMVTYDENDEPAPPVESFGTTIYTRQKATFSGTAFDNNVLKGVYVEVKWLTDDDYHFLKYAALDGNDWKIDLDFGKEGACWLKFIAEDTKNNYGVKSAKVITLFVDNNAPKVGEAWYIDRLVNGIQYSLSSKEALEEILAQDKNLTNPSNKDVAQNGEFIICGSLTDATGIADEDLCLSIWDENGKRVVGNIEKDESSTSNYAPKFRINQTIANLAETGKHYYQIRYSAKDLVKDPAPNFAEDQELEMGWFLWWPESDNPKYHIANVDSDDKQIKVNTGDSLNITVFDDDALKGDVVCELIGEDIVEPEGGQKTISSDTERDCNVILKAPDVPQSMKLTISATDKYGKVLSIKDINVIVTDDFKPTLILTSPENNQIPTVEGNDANINFSGITLDKAGCKYLEFVWVPDSVATTVQSKTEKAKEILAKIADENTHNAYAPSNESVKKTVLDDGCVLWSAKISSAGKEGSFKKHTFDFNLSLLNDFGSDKIADKYFIARVTREDGNYTDTELKLAADNIKPEIEPVNPAGNMAIVDKDIDLEIKFRGTKTSGILMNTEKYKLSYITTEGIVEPLSASYDSVENVYKYTVPKATLAEYDAAHENPKFRYEIEDVLGNKNSGDYQFMISALPQIKNVTSSASEKCKMGDEIRINVAFTKPVSCTSDTYLKLKGIVNTQKSITADTIVKGMYESGSGSTTLIFKYVVQPGDTSDALQVYNESDVGPISGMSEDSVHLKTLDAENNL